jgi:hypothetical protein
MQTLLKGKIGNFLRGWFEMIYVIDLFGIWRNLAFAGFISIVVLLILWLLRD